MKTLILFYAILGMQIQSVTGLPFVRPTVTGLPFVRPNFEQKAETSKARKGFEFGKKLKRKYK